MIEGRNIVFLSILAHQRRPESPSRAENYNFHQWSVLYARRVEINFHRRRLSVSGSATRSTFRFIPLIFLSDETGFFAGMIFRSSARAFSAGTMRAIACRCE